MLNYVSFPSIHWPNINWFFSQVTCLKPAHCVAHASSWKSPLVNQKNSWRHWLVIVVNALLDVVTFKTWHFFQIKIVFIFMNKDSLSNFHMLVFLLTVTQPDRFVFGRQRDAHEFLNMLFMTFTEYSGDQSAEMMKRTFFGQLITAGERIALPSHMLFLYWFTSCAIIIIIIIIMYQYFYDSVTCSKCSTQRSKQDAFSMLDLEVVSVN